MSQITLRLKHNGQPVTVNSALISHTYIDDDRGHTVIVMDNGLKFLTEEKQKDLQQRINAVEQGNIEAALS